MPPTFSPLVPLFPTLPHLLCTLVYALTYTRARVGLWSLCDFNQGVHFFRKFSLGTCAIKKPV